MRVRREVARPRRLTAAEGVLEASEHTLVLLLDGAERVLLAAQAGQLRSSSSCRRRAGSASRRRRGARRRRDRCPAAAARRDRASTSCSPDWVPGRISSAHRALHLGVARRDVGLQGGQLDRRAERGGGHRQRDACRAGRRPARVKTSWCATSISTYRSPAGPPPGPTSPWPDSCTRLPASTPGRDLDVDRRAARGPGRRRSTRCTGRG